MLPIFHHFQQGKASPAFIADIQHVDALEQHIDADLSGLNVLFDCANGASAKVAQKLFPRLGCQCSFTGTLDDGVSVNDGCGSTHLDRLEKKVVEGGFDCGIAFDGDADRCLACDEKGAEIDGDKIIALVAKDMKDRGRLDGNKRSFNVGAFTETWG